MLHIITKGYLQELVETSFCVCVFGFIIIIRLFLVN